MRTEPSATGLTPVTEIPPRETWDYIVAADPKLFRPDWPWKQTFTGWRSVTRLITVGGIQMAAHFVSTEQEKFALTCNGGWTDVTEAWLAEQEAAAAPAPVEPEPLSFQQMPHLAEPYVDMPLNDWTWERITGMGWNTIRSLVKSLGGDATGSRGDLNLELARLRGVPVPGA